MAFNDAMWAKVRLGRVHGAQGRSRKPYTRNVFNRMTKDDLHLLMQALQTPTIPAFGEMVPALGIENLQKMGTKFLLLRQRRSAAGAWSSTRGARARRRTSKKICGPISCPASRSCRRW
jgi:hypothetical protein